MKFYPKYSAKVSASMTSEERRLREVNEYRAMAEWYRQRDDERMAKFCIEAADNLAQMDLVLTAKGKEKHKPKPDQNQLGLFAEVKK